MGSLSGGFPPNMKCNSMAEPQMAEHGCGCRSGRCRRRWRVSPQTDAPTTLPPAMPTHSENDLRLWLRRGACRKDSAAASLLRKPPQRVIKGQVVVCRSRVEVSAGKFTRHLLVAL